MVAKALVLALVLSGAPERARFLFELRGVPVGMVDLSWEPGSGSYQYRSTHLFTRGQDRSALTRTASFRLDAAGRTAAGEHLSSLWVWRGPSAGKCVPGREELGERRDALCLHTLAPDGSARGTLLGERFQARYEGGRMRELILGPARFIALPAGAQLAAPVDLFGEGFPVDGERGTLALEPALELPVKAEPLRATWDEREARALARQVHEAFPDKRPGPADLGPVRDEEDGGAGSCAAHVRRFVQRARQQRYDARVVHGLVAEPQERRAWPHVWVRVALAGGGTLDLDPTSLDEVSPHTHLVLVVTGDGEVAGQVWLRLLSGKHRVVRRAAHPGDARRP